MYDNYKSYGPLTLKETYGGKAYSVLDCEKDATEAVIPKEVDGKPVVDVVDFAFEDCVKLKKVTFPENEYTDFEEGEGPMYFHEIGYQAFGGCIALEEVVLPDVGFYTVGQSAFYGCSSLKRAVFPRGAYVGSYAFSSCSSLTEVTKVKDVSEGAFSYCSSLTYLPIDEGTSVISEDAFEHCSSLRDIVIPSSVKLIEPLAFRGCENLASVTFSDPFGWQIDSSYTDKTYDLDLSDPALNARRLSGMDFDDGILAWRKK